MKKIGVLIQARSTSSRLPGKIFEIIGKKPVLQHVIDACNKAAYFLSNEKARNPVDVKVALLIPLGDKIGPIYKGKVEIYEGSEDDVFSRYFDAFVINDFDYTVRITSDCVLIPPHIISRTIQIAMNNNLDYVENVEESIRTSPDGFDVEVLSKKAMIWLNNNISTKEEKEHCTIALRTKNPSEIRRGHIVNYFDASSLKISIDTAEDLEKCRKEYDKLQRALFSNPNFMIFRM
jgi:spore coat polysaccharide biosynthesis protein SpsF